MGKDNPEKRMIFPLLLVTGLSEANRTYHRKNLWLKPSKRKGREEQNKVSTR